MDPMDWMPEGMDPADKQEYLDAHPDDPHAAAAEAWEAWAASMPPTGADGVKSVSTGAQSVTYGGNGSGAYGVALSRASWHRTRARVKSVAVGNEYGEAAPAETAPAPYAARTMNVNRPAVDDSNRDEVWHTGWSP